eukprot:COSAG03_NODE_10448_length_650_cov_1.404719_2_plen_161_part_00
MNAVGIPTELDATPEPPLRVLRRPNRLCTQTMMGRGAVLLATLVAHATAECNPPMKCTDPTVQACWLHHAALGCPHGSSPASCDLCDPGAGGGPICSSVKSAEGCCAACNEWNVQHTADYQCNAWIWNASPDDPSAHAPRCLLKVRRSVVIASLSLCHGC